MAARSTPTSNSQSRDNSDFVDFRFNAQDKKLDQIDSKVDKGFDNINKRIDKFTFAPISALEKIEDRMDKFEEKVETEYVKKSDNATLRNIGIAILTAVGITITTLVITGGLRNAQ